MLLAVWESRGGRWRAELSQDGAESIALREYKHGSLVGASYRTFEQIQLDGWRSVEAWAAQQVAYGFDVQMERKAI